MKKNFHWQILILAPLFLTAIFFLPQPSFAQPLALQPNPPDLALVDAVNALRRKNSLPPYQASPALMRAAQLHAEHIAATGYLSHYERSLSPYQRAIEQGYAVAGNLNMGGLFAENLYAGAGVSAEGVVAAWRADKTLAAALLSSQFEDAGAGVALGSDGLTYFVLDVGAELDDPTLLFTATPTATVPFMTSTPNEDGTVRHTVRANEALWELALQYNTTVDEIKKLNRLSSDDIYEGQELLMYKPKPEEVFTPTPTFAPTATLGIPTSTSTQPVLPTATQTAMPQPVAPLSFQSSGLAVAVIVVLALLGAGGIAFLAGRRQA
ncbi:MAG: hypothetical protein Fur002_14090 [Anaerolineales bacterium]